MVGCCCCCCGEEGEEGVVGVDVGGGMVWGDEVDICGLMSLC